MASFPEPFWAQIMKPRIVPPPEKKAPRLVAPPKPAPSGYGPTTFGYGPTTRRPQPIMMMTRRPQPIMMMTRRPQPITRMTRRPQPIMMAAKGYNDGPMTGWPQPTMAAHLAKPPPPRPTSKNSGSDDGVWDSSWQSEWWPSWWSSSKGEEDLEKEDESHTHAKSSPTTSEWWSSWWSSSKGDEDLEQSSWWSSSKGDEDLEQSSWWSSSKGDEDLEQEDESHTHAKSSPTAESEFEWIEEEVDNEEVIKMTRKVLQQHLRGVPTAPVQHGRKRQRRGHGTRRGRDSDLVKLEVGRLRFSQASCKSTFQDGRSVNGLVSDLMRGKIKLTAPFLRLTVFETTDEQTNETVFRCIDNRRLLALKRYAEESGKNHLMVHVKLHNQNALRDFYRFLKNSDNTPGVEVEVRNNKGRNKAKDNRWR